MSGANPLITWAAVDFLVSNSMTLLKADQLQAKCYFPMRHFEHKSGGNAVQNTCNNNDNFSSNEPEMAAQAWFCRRFKNH